MKLGLYADPHISLSSSIVVGKTGSLSGRLDNLVKSFDWMNNLFKESNCDKIICLGDLVDKPTLNSEEITAMKLCNIDDHYIILGNHCRSSNNGEFNSVNMYHNVIIEPSKLEGSDNVYMLPYGSTETDIASIVDDPTNAILLTHGDIKGLSYGRYVSEVGYEISTILKYSRLMINGHLHAGKWVIKDRILNLGSITGQNFSSTDYEWEPSVCILDTDTFDIDFYENPVAFVFHKLTCNSQESILKFINGLSKGKSHIVQIKVPVELADITRELINSTDEIPYSRVIPIMENTTISKKTNTSEILLTKGSDYDKLREFVTSKYKDSTKVDLESVLKEIDNLEVDNLDYQI